MPIFIRSKSKIPGPHILSILLALPFLLILHTLAHAQSPSGQPNFTLKPTTFNPAVPATKASLILNTKAGSKLSVSMRVGNAGTVTGRVVIYPVTASTASTSGIAYQSKRSTLLDVASWTQLNQQQLTLAPGQSQVIPFQIVVPANASAGQHMGGIVAENLVIQRSTAKGITHVNLQQFTIMGVQINITGTAVKKIKVTGVHLRKSHGYQSMLVRMENSSDTALTPTGTVEISNPQGRVVQNLPFTLNSMAPNTSIDYPVSMHALAPGNYHVSVLLHYGTGQMLHYSTDISVTQKKDQFSESDISPTLLSPHALDKTPHWEITLALLAAIILILSMSQRLYGRMIKTRRTQATTSGKQRNDSYKQEEDDARNRKV